MGHFGPVYMGLAHKRCGAYSPVIREPR